MSRYFQKFNAQVLTDWSYTWASVAYSKFLIKDTLPAATRVTTETGITNAVGSYATTTLSWILQRKYGNKTILNGPANGGLKIRVNNTDTGNGNVYIYAVVSLTVKNSSGTERVLGTVTTGEYSRLNDSGYDTTFDLPFWIDVEGEQVINADERFILKVVYYCKVTVGDGAAYYVYAKTTLNADDTFIQIPIVPGSEE